MYPVGVDLIGVGVFSALMIGLGAVLSRKALLRS